MRVVHRLLDAKYRCRRNTGLPQHLNCRLIAGQLCQPMLDYLDHLRAVFEPRCVISETRIGTELWPSDDVAELHPVMIEPGEDKQVAVATLENPGWTQSSIMLAGTLRPHNTTARAHHLHIEVVIMEVCIQQ